MPFLPVVSRELRIASQRSSTFQLRAAAALTAFVFFLYVSIFTYMGNFSFARMGSNLLTLISIVSFIYCLFAGVFYTSDCLSVERRHGTMGLLFLTKLRSYDITAGKLVAHSLSSVYGLVATIPILALSVIFGGVTDQQFIRTVLVLFNSLFLSLCVGLLASALFLEARKSMTFTILILAALCFAPLLIDKALGGVFDSTYLLSILFLSSPFTLLKTAWSGMMILPFWSSFWFLFGIGCACFVMSSFVTSKWNKPAPLSRDSPIWDRINSSPTLIIRALRSARLSTRSTASSSEIGIVNAPFGIIATKSNTENTLMWLLLVLGSIAYTWMFFRPETMIIGIGLYALFPLHIVIKVLITADACRKLHQDRNSGLLELLYVTPEPIEQLPLAYSKSIRRHYFRLASVLAMLNILALIGFHTHLMRQTSFQLDVFLLVTLILGGGIVILFIDLKALIWVGLKEGLSKRSLNHAIFISLAKTMGPPWLGLMVLVGLLAGGMREGPSFFLILLWQLASLSYVQSISIKNQRALRSKFHSLMERV